MNFPGKGSLLDIIKGSIATLTLFLAYVSFPLVGMLPGLLVPLPAIFYTLKSGRICALVVAITAIVLALVTGPQSAGLYLLQCGVMTLALPEFMVREWGGARSIAAAVALNLALILALAAVYGISQGVDVHGQVLKGINASIAQTVQIYEKSGLTGDELAGLRQGMQQAGVLIGRLYPALLVVSLALIAGLNLALLTKLAAKLPRPLPVGDFKRFKNPEQLVWAVIVAGFAMLPDAPVLTGVALNVLVVTLSLYFIQGMAVILHFFQRFTVPPLVRWICYLLLGLQPYLLVAVAALGIFDIWGDFRAPKPQNL